MASPLGGAEAAPDVVVVEDGDTLWTLAERLGVPWRHLQAENSLQTDLIFTGEVLKVPLRPSTSSSSSFASACLASSCACCNSSSGAPASLASSLSSSGAGLASASVSLSLAAPMALPVLPLHSSAGQTDLEAITSAPPAATPGRTKMLLVEPGDTAWDISERYGLTLDDLQELNGTIPDVLYPGDILLLPENAEEVTIPRWPGWNFKAVKARIKGLAADANDKFFDVFPAPKDVDDVDGYRERYRILLNALRHVETSFIMPAPVGDGGLSIGPLQISTAYHTDAWWQATQLANYAGCEEVEYAERTVINYWLRWCPWALEYGDSETLARTHNGGPQFWHHLSTCRYWRKVRSAMRRQGCYKGIPELNCNALDGGFISLYNTHIPFSVPFLEPPIYSSSSFLDNRPNNLSDA